jgi:putative FmdB family regulatory protein
MPFYEYQCKACGAHHEAMQKISDPPLKKCPECGKSRLVKLISAPVFRLKGGGWYETDFKSDQETKRNLAGEEKAEKADSTDKGDAKKPDAKADAKPEAKADKAEPKLPAKPAKPAKTGKPAARASKPAPKRPAAKAAKKGARRR